MVLMDRRLAYPENVFDVENDRVDTAKLLEQHRSQGEDKRLLSSSR